MASWVGGGRAAQGWVRSRLAITVTGLVLMQARHLSGRCDRENFDVSELLTPPDSARLSSTVLESARPQG